MRRPVLTGLRFYITFISGPAASLLVRAEQPLLGEAVLKPGAEGLAAQPLKPLPGPTTQALYPRRVIGRRKLLKGLYQRLQLLLALMRFDQAFQGAQARSLPGLSTLGGFVAACRLFLSNAATLLNSPLLALGHGDGGDRSGSIIF